MFRSVAVFITAVLAVSSVQGQTVETDWTLHVIPAADRSFDFKTVAKGATPEHKFLLKNPFQETMHFVSITSSCACTEPLFDLEKSELKTYEEVSVSARFRGDMFDGSKNATITVVIDKPFHAEILLNVRGDIRSDCKITPSYIDFGEVSAGKEESRTLTVTYTGPFSQWRIADAQCGNESIRTEITSEPFLLGKRVFNVKVFLAPTTPQGKLEEYLVLTINDAASRREIPIQVSAAVGADISVTPRTLFLGVFEPGETPPPKLVVLRGTKPFRIKKIECDNPGITIPFEIKEDLPPKTVYPLSVQYSNPKEGEGAPKKGAMLATVSITTDLPDIKPFFHITMKLREE